jgi:hypothetical protein
MMVLKMQRVNIPNAAIKQPCHACFFAWAANTACAALSDQASTCTDIARRDAGGHALHTRQSQPEARYERQPAASSGDDMPRGASSLIPLACESSWRERSASAYCICRRAECGSPCCLRPIGIVEAVSRDNFWGAVPDGEVNELSSSLSIASLFVIAFLYSTQRIMVLSLHPLSQHPPY